MSPRISCVLASFLSLGAIALTASILQPGVVGASPIFANNTTSLRRNPDSSTRLRGNDGVLLQGRTNGKKPKEWDDLLLYGWEIVDKAKGDEYNSKKELTSIPALKISLGEGAYLMRDLGSGLPEHLSSADDMECIVGGSAQKIKEAPKKFLPDSVLKTVFHNPGNLAKELKDAELEVADTILSSRTQINQKDIGFQMVIPPHYLPISQYVKDPPPYTADQPPPYVKDPPPPGANILETQVFCVPLGCFKKPPTAPWETIFGESFGESFAEGGEKRPQTKASADRVPKPAHCPEFPDWVQALLKPNGGFKGLLKKVTGKGKGKSA